MGYLDDLYDCRDGWRAYLIKSGPGSGKSTLIKTVMQHMVRLGYDAEAILCSSDPASLDGVVFRQLKLCLFDATSPHIIEPHYWGAVEQIVNLSACSDSAFLYERREGIREASDACSALHARCRRFLGAASSLLNDNARTALEYTDAAKISRNAARIAAREFGAASSGDGREWKRFLSAVTPPGNGDLPGNPAGALPADLLLGGRIRRVFPPAAGRAAPAGAGCGAGDFHLRLSSFSLRLPGASAHPLAGGGLYHLQFVA